jgi:hypothetical protein
LIGKPKGKSSLGRPKNGWEVNIKMDLMEVQLEVWIVFIWLRIGTSGGLL